MTTFLCLHVNTGLQFIHDVAGHCRFRLLVEVLTTAVRDDADLVLIALDSLPLRLTQPDAGKHLLNVVGEVSLYNPSVVTGIAGYHLADGFAFILTEVEVLGHHGLAFTVEDGIALSILGLTPHDATGEVNIIVDLREVGQALHIVRQHTALRCRRYESIVNERYDFFDKEKMKGDFLAYFKEKAEKKNCKWEHVYKHFERFCVGKCRFDEINVDLCNKFREYLMTDVRASAWLLMMCFCQMCSESVPVRELKRLLDLVSVVFFVTLRSKPISKIKNEKN